MKKSVRQSKYDPLVEEVMLLDSNPQYALIRHKDGRESTVSTRQLAPPGECPNTQYPEQLQQTESTVSTRQLAPPGECPNIQYPEQSQQPYMDENVQICENGESPTDCQPGSSPQPLQSHQPESPHQQSDSVSDIMSKQGRVHPYNLRNRLK